MPSADEWRARLGLSYNEEVPELTDLNSVAILVDDPIKALNNSGVFEILERGDFL